MAWTAPPTYIAGAILTAAQMNAISANLLAGGPVYTTEALRDAAITSPFEGQRAYITAPTVPTAAGATTYVPGGVQTVYNGSVWVCTTPVSAFQPATGTTTSTTYSASLSGSPGTNPTVTLVTGTTALVSIRFFGAQAGAGHSAFMAISTATVSGAEINGMQMYASTAGAAMGIGCTFVMSGLTAGTNTFTPVYKTTNPAQVATVLNRGLTVQGIA